MKLATLGFQEEAGAQAAGEWRGALEWLVDSALSRVKAIRILPEIAAARRKIELHEDSAIDQAKAQRLGELLDAQRVLWGSYRRVGERWEATARLLNVSRGKASASISASSADLLQLRDQLVRAVLEELRVVPTEEERALIVRRPTTSAAALQAFTRGFRGDESFVDAERSMREALAADPEFVDAQVGLGALLGSQGKFDEAMAVVRGAIERAPQDATAHLVLGVCHLMENGFDAAEVALRESERLSPDDPETAIRLAEVLRGQGKMDEAVECLNRAVPLSPLMGTVHSALAYTLALRGNRERAMAEAQTAERLEEDVNSAQMLAVTYELLGETSLAVRHYERFVELARKAGANPKGVGLLEERGKKLKASLEPTSIEVPLPRVYTETELQEALRSKLTPEERKAVVNPLEATPELRQWASDLARGIDDPRARARVLFHGLATRIDPGGHHGTRSAREVFTAWKDPEQSFSCQEYAKLFVALARAVDLQAFFVHLEADHAGRPVFHDCAAVYIDGKALLVDPAYRWFGVPHREFVVLDDLQTIGHQLYESREGDRVTSRRTAAKLFPGFAMGLLNLAAVLAEEGKFAEERKEIEAAERIAPDRWYVLTARGILTLKEGRVEDAEILLYRALARNPEDPDAHFALARILHARGNLKEAREHFRHSLGPDSHPANVEAARRRIAEINEEIGVE